eukprot:SAG22_NODE_303_length_12721_cov_3.439075_5_plen_190_part_00
MPTIVSASNLAGILAAADVTGPTSNPDRLWKAVSAPGLAGYFETSTFGPEETIYETGQAASAVYLVQLGHVHAVPGQSATTRDRDGVVAEQRAEERELAHNARWRHLRYETGAAFGEVEFFLRHARYWSAVAGEDGCSVARPTSEQLEAMQSADPAAALALHNALLRWVCRSLAVDISGGRRHHGRDQL